MLCPLAVFTPRVIGTAVARYNFAARDMRELSLREGDVVKIYSRIGGDQGWWKGETNGRVSAASRSCSGMSSLLSGWQREKGVSHVLPLLAGFWVGCHLLRATSAWPFGAL